MMDYGSDLDNRYMRMAIEMGRCCPDSKKFGAVVVYFGGESEVVIASAFSMQTINNDITRHAELVAIGRASQAMQKDTGKLRLCTLYTTCEPCLMCWGAVLWAKIGRVVYGMEPTQSPHNFSDSIAVYRVHGLPLNGPGLPNPQVRGGVLVDECLALMP